MRNDRALPSVSVIMSVWQAADTLPQAINSVLEQTYSDFELLLLDDASADATPAIIADFARKDSRIRVFTHTVNKGLTVSLNELLHAARGTYLARMDADDRAIPERLHTQVNYLQQHPAAAACGSWAADLHDPEKILKMPVTQRAIWQAMLTGNPFLHPTMMLRRQVLLAHGLQYSEHLQVAQDFDLWARLLPLAEIHNIPQVLLRYNQAGSRLTDSRREEQLQITRQVRRELLIRICPALEPLWQHPEFTLQDIARYQRYIVSGKASRWCQMLHHDIRYALWRSLPHYNARTLWRLLTSEILLQKGFTATQQKKLLVQHVLPRRYRSLL